MAIDYAKVRDRASRMIRENGKRGVLRVAGAESGEPWDATVAETDHDCWLVVSGFVRLERGNVQAGDKIVLVSVEDLDHEPTPKDKLVIDGAVHAITGTEPLKPGETLVLHTVYARE